MLISTLQAAEKWTGFERFVYRGTDPYAEKVAAGQYLNPIVAGFTPDPSICRAGDDFYLVNSSFSYFPGVPIFHSHDLVNWKQIGNAIDHGSSFGFDGKGVSEGIFAPAITFHDGLFYLITTDISNKGNFFITAKNPAGPWSEPVRLRDIDGMDPSLVFDDGKVYVVNCASPDGKPLYSGHRAIRLREIDPATGKNLELNRVLVNGGMHLEQKPIWSEGPHIFKRENWYYLTCAEGGTGPGHAQMVYRSEKIDGPYVAFEGNPILTQRDMPRDRVDPVTSTGHADLVEAPDGKWWTVFLGVRPYARDFNNIGRETFLLPVDWKDGWPLILKKGVAVPRVVDKAGLAPSDSRPLTGNLESVDEFDAGKLGLEWISLRKSYLDWSNIIAGTLRIEAREPRLTGKNVPAFIGRRQQHELFTAETDVIAGEETCDAGLTAFQGERWHFFLGVKLANGKAAEVFLERVAGGDSQVVAKLPVDGDRVQLKIAGDPKGYTFFYRVGQTDWQPIGGSQDATILSTNRAGGFVGTVVGMHVRK